MDQRAGVADAAAATADATGSDSIRVQSHGRASNSNPPTTPTSTSTASSSDGTEMELDALAKPELDIEALTKQILNVLAKHRISQLVFGERVVGCSQGHLHNLLWKPKPFSQLSAHGKRPYYKMQAFMEKEGFQDRIDELTSLRGGPKKRSQNDDDSSETEIHGRPRKKRVTFTIDQRSTLEDLFEENTYPSREEIEGIAENLIIPSDTVRFWFNNKRRLEKKRRAEQEMNPEAFEYNNDQPYQNAEEAMEEEEDDGDDEEEDDEEDDDEDGEEDDDDEDEDEEEEYEEEEAIVAAPPPKPAPITKKQGNAARPYPTNNGKPAAATVRLPVPKIEAAAAGAAVTAHPPAKQTASKPPAPPLAQAPPAAQAGKATGTVRSSTTSPAAAQARSTAQVQTSGTTPTRGSNSAPARSPAPAQVRTVGSSASGRATNTTMAVSSSAQRVQNKQAAATVPIPGKRPPGPAGAAAILASAAKTS